VGKKRMRDIEGGPPSNNFSFARVASNKWYDYRYKHSIRTDGKRGLRECEKGGSYVSSPWGPTTKWMGKSINAKEKEFSRSMVTTKTPRGGLLMFWEDFSIVVTS